MAQGGHSVKSCLSTQVTPCNAKYNYKVKVLNPFKRKKAVTRQMHDFKGRFETVNQLKTQIFKELCDELPEDSASEVGYFEDRQASSKVWMVKKKDLDAMYREGGRDFFLWIQTTDEDSDDSDEGESCSKKKSSSKKKKKVLDFDEVYEKLRKQHEGEGYNIPQLKMWARMLCCGTHDEYDKPPKSAMITGVEPSRPKKDSFTAAITGAAEAVAKVLSPQSSQSVPQASGTVGISPVKKTELRMKNLEQLRVLQQLYEASILSDAEFKMQIQSYVAK